MVGGVGSFQCCMYDVAELTSDLLYVATAEDTNFQLFCCCHREDNII